MCGQGIGGQTTFVQGSIYSAGNRLHSKQRSTGTATVSLYIWMAIAFVAGVTSVIVYYKGLPRISCATLFVLPVIIVALLGWPDYDDFQDTSFLSVIYWIVLAFGGAAVGTAAVGLRIIR
jgi:hypothetical protein